jgi:hypothetical protein
MIPNVIERYFYGVLGTSAETRASSIESIRAACGAMFDTYHMKVLSHIAWCIDVSIRSQTKALVIIQENTYEGVYLAGARYRISYKGLVYQPASRQRCMQLYNAHPSHFGCLRAIMDIAGIHLVPPSMRSLRNALIAMDLSQSQVTDIQRFAKGLSFKQLPLAINSSTVQFAMRVINGLDTMLDTVYLHLSCLFSHDHVELTLAAFGYMSFTFDVMSSPMISLTKGIPPKPLIIRPMTLSSAVESMKAIRGQKKLHNGLTGKSHMLITDREISDTYVQDVWNLVVDFSTVAVSSSISTNVVVTKPSVEESIDL